MSRRRGILLDKLLKALLAQVLPFDHQVLKAAPPVGAGKLEGEPMAEQTTGISSVRGLAHIGVERTHLKPSPSLGARHEISQLPPTGTCFQWLY